MSSFINSYEIFFSVEVFLRQKMIENHCYENFSFEQLLLLRLLPRLVHSSLLLFTYRSWSSFKTHLKFPNTHGCIHESSKHLYHYAKGWGHEKKTLKTEFLE